MSLVFVTWGYHKLDSLLLCLLVITLARVGGGHST